jgi:hypothetical protein
LRVRCPTRPLAVFALPRQALERRRGKDARSAGQTGETAASWATAAPMRKRRATEKALSLSLALHVGVGVALALSLVAVRS